MTTLELNPIRMHEDKRGRLSPVACDFKCGFDRDDPRWQRQGNYSARALETAAFTIFLYPRMLGCAAEIDDHMNRGRNMDTRTPASQCRFVA